MRYLNHVVSDSAVIVVTDHGLKSVHQSNPFYAQLVASLRKGEFDKSLQLLDVAGRIKMHSKGQFCLKDGQVYHKGTLMPKSLSDRVLQFADAGISFKPLEKFWENCLQNRSERSRNELFPFLEHNHIPLTEDGCFICYKRVSEDWKDCHTRQIDNSIGAVVRMRWEDVDPDPKQTCSRGLHVAAFGYAKDFYSNGHLVAVKVNPKDVVAVPEEYKNEKMRVCEYAVMEQVAGPRKELVYAEFRVGAIVAVLPNLDNAQDYFVGKVIEVIEREDQNPLYRIQKVNSDEVVTYPQHHVMWLDRNGDDDEEQEICPDCNEVECVCDDLIEDEDDDEEDEDDADDDEEESEDDYY